MVARLLTGFNLLELYACIGGGIVKHLLEQRLGHEMGAGAGGQISAAGAGAS